MNRYYSSEEYLKNKLVNESKDLDTFLEQLQRIKTAKVITFTPSNTPVVSNGGKVAKVTVFRDAIEEIREATAIRDYKIREAYIKQRIDFEMKIRNKKIQMINDKIDALLKSNIKDNEDILLDILRREFLEHVIVHDEFEQKRYASFENAEFNDPTKHESYTERD